MGKITYIYGPMKSGKTELLIEKIQYFRNTNCEVVVLKPIADTRDGLYVKSRAKDIQVLAYGISDNNSLIQVEDLIYQIKQGREINIFLDEIHFLSSEVLFDIIKLALDNDNINIYLCGLEYTFKGSVFGSHVLALGASETIIEVSGRCPLCKIGRSKYNILMIDGKMVTDGDTNRPGDSEYITCCNMCLIKLQNN